MPTHCLSSRLCKPPAGSLFRSPADGGCPQGMAFCVALRFVRQQLVCFRQTEIYWCFFVSFLRFLRQYFTARCLVLWFLFWSCLYCAYVPESWTSCQSAKLNYSFAGPACIPCMLAKDQPGRCTQLRYTHHISPVLSRTIHITRGIPNISCQKHPDFQPRHQLLEDWSLSSLASQELKLLPGSIFTCLTELPLSTILRAEKFSCSVQRDKNHQVALLGAGLSGRIRWRVLAHCHPAFISQLLMVIQYLQAGEKKCMKNERFIFSPH